eukprot:1128397-Rhodomonas_salina.1
MSTRHIARRQKAEVTSESSSITLSKTLRHGAKHWWVDESRRLVRKGRRDIDCFLVEPFVCRADAKANGRIMLGSACGGRNDLRHSGLFIFGIERSKRNPRLDAGIIMEIARPASKMRTPGTAQDFRFANRGVFDSLQEFLLFLAACVQNSPGIIGER